MADLVSKQPAVLAASIFILTCLLKPDRRRLFMEWLCAHSGQELYCARDSLADWFGSLSETKALREYGLVVREINWWRDLSCMRFDDVCAERKKYDKKFS